MGLGGAIRKKNNGDMKNGDPKNKVHLVEPDRKRNPLKKKKKRKVVSGEKSTLDGRRKRGGGNGPSKKRGGKVLRASHTSKGGRGRWKGKSLKVS